MRLFVVRSINAFQMATLDWSSICLSSEGISLAEKRSRLYWGTALLVSCHHACHAFSTLQTHPPPPPSFFRCFATLCVPCLAASRLLSWRAQTRATEHTHSPSTESFCGPCLRLAWPAFLLGRLMLHISTIISWSRLCRVTAQGVFVLYLYYCCL